MGYQESYVKMKSNDDFNKLIELVNEIGEDYYEEGGAYPTEIITLKKSIQGNLEFMGRPDKEYKFHKGEKFIYFVGERYLQSELKNLFNNKKKEGIEIYFSECFPTDLIFENYENEYAEHEEFIWSKLV